MNRIYVKRKNDVLVTLNHDNRVIFYNSVFVETEMSRHITNRLNEPCFEEIQRYYKNEDVTFITVDILLLIRHIISYIF